MIVGRASLIRPLNQFLRLALGYLMAQCDTPDPVRFVRTDEQVEAVFFILHYIVGTSANKNARTL